MFLHLSVREPGVLSCLSWEGAYPVSTRVSNYEGSVIDVVKWPGRVVYVLCCDLEWSDEFDWAHKGWQDTCCLFSLLSAKLDCYKFKEIICDVSKSVEHSNGEGYVPSQISPLPPVEASGPMH